ncbi:alpha/beta fold hydrolase [Nocardia seriolae]|uniref:alpha/beta fold hydrolase n=1 Tax=Nocardia seriolae TaxID=37332 RepID=UPI00118F9B1A|nr:alpha/beta hydrolase [Nocardia seriolae]QOW35537.1 alpha/beta hydrolase [Nocardia seriolae]QUN16977.1 alpha/beta hydrolase [Nocardia seriolae]WKY55915.1 alpha/beta hydrolase [Nocardia seriolae]WNJ55907.1 alpha/beta hydrolase [Nocardia seriolae]GEM24803.1 3-oxoadipate enol-lactonase [Nocardia seriolae NBRC 15557]
MSRGAVKIHYTDSGGDGPGVVLGHSLFMDQEMFAAQQEALAPEYRVIAVDSRGHGGTEDDETPFSYWDLARDAWAVVDELGLERVVVGGVAHGAFTAVRMALLARPRVAGLIVVGASGTAMSPQRRIGYREVLDLWMGGAIPGPTIKMVASLMIGAGPEDQRPWRAKWAGGQRERVRLAGACLVNRDSVMELLGEIDCPALVLRGLADQAITAEEVAALAAALGNPTTVHTIAGASMTPNLTHAAEFNALLREFLDGLPG